jgi:uncharacterized integral membrane protein (TIGR00698 family)
MTWLIQEVRRQDERREAGRGLLSFRTLVPGLLVAGTIALLAYGIERVEVSLVDHRVIEGLVIALLIGVVAANTLGVSETVQPGATFASKSVLELAVVLLGSSIDIDQVLAGGVRLLVAVSLGVLLGLTMSLALGRLLRLPPRLAFLVAIGNAICGNSAIAAVAPVVKAERHEVASAIGLTAIAGVIVILILPLTLPQAGVGHYQYGVVVGMSVYAVPQVVAAAFAVSPLSAQVATLVKLMRVMFLGPVVLTTGLVVKLRGRGDTKIKRSQLLPWFVIGFFVFLCLRSLGAIPAEAIDPLRQSGKALTVWAMAGLGLGVELAAIRSVGPRLALTSVLSMALLVALSIGLALALDLDGGGL